MLVVLAAAIALAGSSVDVDIGINDRNIAGEAREQRAINRHDAANETAGAMFLVGILVMPLGLTALILAVRLPTRE